MSKAGQTTFQFAAAQILVVLLSLALAPAASTATGGGQTPTPAQTVPPTGRFERISVAEGLSYPVVQDIVQDRQGYMWFATSQGLNRYDGANFTIFRHDPNDPTSLPFDQVTDMLVDSDGTLWLAGPAGLASYNPAGGTFDHLFRAGQVAGLFEDAAGRLWFSNWQGLHAMDRSDGRLIVRPAGARPAPSSGSVLKNMSWSLVEQPAGVLWLNSVYGLSRLDLAAGRLDRIVSLPGQLGVSIAAMPQAMVTDAQGRLWVGTWNRGLVVLDSQGNLIRHYAPGSGPGQAGRAGLTSGSIIAVLVDSRGEVWIGTTAGLDHLDPATGRFDHFRSDPADPGSLSDDVVTSLYEDRSGVLWAGTANGLSKLNAQANPFHLLQKVRPGAAAGGQFILSDDKVVSVAQDSQGRLWLGTFSGGLNLLDPATGQVTVFRHDPADPTTIMDDQISAVFEDHAGVLWLATGSGDLEKYDPQTGDFIPIRSIGQVSWNGLAEDGNGNLWLAMNGNGLYRLNSFRTGFAHRNASGDPDFWWRYGGLSHGTVNTLMFDHEGAMWAGTYAGGINYSPSIADKYDARFSHYRRDQSQGSLSNENVTAFYEDPAAFPGLVWVGTSGGGLNRLDRATGRLTAITTADGLASDIIGCIQADDRRRLWLGTARGLSRYDPQTGQIRNFAAADGVPVSVIVSGNCLRLDDGRLLFAGLNGAVIFDPDQVTENPIPPPVVISGIQLFNETLRRDPAGSQPLELTYRQNHLAFEYAALDYTRPEQNTYATMLEGLNDDWVYTGSRRVEYLNLDPGDYVFRVKAANSDGIWNEQGAAVSLTIQPPFWETWWFRALAVVALGGLVLGASGWRSRAERARRRELEQQVEARTAELSQANTRLAGEIAERQRAEEALAQQRAEAAVVRERARLSHELHDSVNQSLYAIALFAHSAGQLLSNGHPAAAAENVHKVERSAVEALGEMRLLVYELRPPVLDEVGLVGALRERLAAVERRAGLAAELQAEGIGRLPPAVEHALFRVASEALNNVLKHAQAGRVTVTLHQAGDELLLAVEDDGQGFDLAAGRQKGGLGLPGMAERVQQFGGRLEICSQPGQGTRLAVRLKVKP